MRNEARSKREWGCNQCSRVAPIWSQTLMRSHHFRRWVQKRVHQSGILGDPGADRGVEWKLGDDLPLGLRGWEWMETKTQSIGVLDESGWELRHSRSCTWWGWMGTKTQSIARIVDESGWELRHSRSCTRWEWMGTKTQSIVYLMRVDGN